MIFYSSTLIVSVLALKLKGDSELEKKTKVKVWKDIDKVVKASVVPKKLRGFKVIMEEIPKNNKP